jgi:hypothetical protein
MASCFAFGVAVGIPFLYFYLLYSARRDLDPEVPLFDDNHKPYTYEHIMKAKLRKRAQNQRIKHLAFLFEAYEVGQPVP